MWYRTIIETLSKCSSWYHPKETIPIIPYSRRHFLESMISKLSRLLGNVSFCRLIRGCRFVPYTNSDSIRHRWYQAGSRYWWVPRVWKLDSGPNLHPWNQALVCLSTPIHHQASFRFLKECRWQHVQGHRIMSTSKHGDIMRERTTWRPPQKKVHPGRLRWNTIMEIWKRIFLSIGCSMLISRCAFVLDFLLMGHRVQQCELFGEFYFSSLFICPCWLQNKNIHDEFWRLMIIQSTQTQKTSILFGRERFIQFDTFPLELI